MKMVESCDNQMTYGLHWKAYVGSHTYSTINSRVSEEVVYV